VKLHSTKQTHCSSHAKQRKVAATEALVYLDQTITSLPRSTVEWYFFWKWFCVKNV